MNPLLIIAAGVWPDIMKAIAGDKAGTVAKAVAEAVTKITRTENPEVAREKLNADPSTYAALQFQLAEIAAQAEMRLVLSKLRYDKELALDTASYEDFSRSHPVDATLMQFSKGSGYERRWLLLLGFAFIQLAFIIGIIVHGGIHVDDKWKEVFVAAAALSIGFGAAVFLYQWEERSRRHALEADFKDLKEHALVVLSKVRRLSHGQTSVSGAETTTIPSGTRS
jgi:hypothetical protein